MFCTLADNAPGNRLNVQVTLIRRLVENFLERDAQQVRVINFLR